MKILITGANGMLGSNLCTMFSNDHEVFATDRMVPDFVGCQNFKMDITDGADLEIIRRIKPDMVIHCAALVDVDYCEEHAPEAFAINCTGTAKLVGSLFSAQKDRCYFVHISTDAVFNGDSGNYNEESIPDPINAYGGSKLCAERAVFDNCGEHGDSVIIRTNIIGWTRQGKESLAEWMLHKLESGKTFPAFKDVYFSPILVNDLGEIILELGRIKHRGIVHVAGRNGCTKLEFAKMIAEVFGMDSRLICPASIDDVRLKARRGRNMVLDVTKASRLLKIKMPDVMNEIGKFKELRENGFLARLKIKRESEQ